MNTSWQEILHLLESGSTRAAFKEDDRWHPNPTVKEIILEAFKAGELSRMKAGYIDKHNLTPRVFELSDGVRIVPFGSTVRRGAYIAKNVIIMPPSYINIGAYVDEGTLIDSHVLVGSCAQIGRNVHLSAGVKIGGVLEPINSLPVIIEDQAFIGAGCVIVEGVQVSKRAVLAPGVVLSRSVPVYDVVHSRLLSTNEPIPENAIVVPGNRKLSTETEFVTKHGLHLACAIIVKYRDPKSDAALALEDALR